ncbi:MAG TPA: DUF4203 domain-containing protein [Candidatus Limnocylindrales bacterium]|nr:DUF4203 domain-containing protein [Candidatus Limnocylindrales bacterium]
MQLLVGILAIVIGLAFAFGGWRFFLFLLPLWGFVVGFSLGTEAMRSLFGDGTFATVTSWVVGFVIALVFALLSYLYYYAAIAVLAGTVGYAIGASAWGLIGNEQGVIAFVVGLVVGVAFAVAVLALDVPRYLVIVLTGLGGAAAVVAGWFILIGKVPADNVTWWEVGQLIRDSWFYLIAWALIAAAGILAQLRGPEMGPDSYQLERSSYRYG